MDRRPPIVLSGVAAYLRHRGRPPNPQIAATVGQVRSVVRRAQAQIEHNAIRLESTRTQIEFSKARVVRNRELIALTAWMLQCLKPDTAPGAAR